MTATQLLGPETFEFFARYLLAGYVVIFVRSAFVIGLRPKPAELLIEAVILSLIVQLVVFGGETLHDAMKRQVWIREHLGQWFAAPPAALKFTMAVLVVPAALGMVLGLFLQSGWRNGFLRRLSLPVVHPVRRAHDFAFGSNRPPGLVEVTFEDGTKIGGWFGENSLAAGDDNRSDLFLERAYIIGDDGDWTEPNEPRSILINLRSVRTVEFLLKKETADAEQG